MSAFLVTSPLESWEDVDGSPLEAGYIYIGESGLNPETNPIAVYWDEGATILAAQPVRTIAGYPSRQGKAAKIYSIKADFSQTVRNKKSELVYSELTQKSLASQQLLAERITHNMALDDDYTLTSDENKQGHINITDTGVLLTAARNIVVANTERVFLVTNATAQDLTFKTAAGTGIQIESGTSGGMLYCDGTNIESVDVFIASQQLFAERITHNMALDADYTLTAAENLKGSIVITDTGTNLTAARNIVVTTTQRIFIAENNTLQTLTFKTASGTGVAVDPGESFILEGDGTNIIHIPEAWYRSADAGGTGDVITATFDPPIEALKDRTRVRVRALGPNTVTGVTFNPDGLGAEPVVMDGNQALLVGSIPGAGFVMILDRNDANSNWELLNPSNSVIAYVAGSVDQAAIGASAVGQAELKTTTGELSTSSNAPTPIALPGGEYGFDYLIKSGGGAGENATIAFNDATSSGDYPVKKTAGTTYANNIYLASNEAIGVGTAYAQQRYVQASPPYFDTAGNLIGRYIFVEIDKNSGDIVSAYSAQEAPWHYNGPTNIRGRLIVQVDDDGNEFNDGKKYRERRDMSAMPFTHAQAKADPAKLRDYYAAFAEAPTIFEEITQAIKDADMHLIPRPMQPTADTVVVMLDPISDLNHQLCEMCCHDEFSINELLHDGLIVIDNTPLNRSGPPGVNIMGFDWK